MIPRSRSLRDPVPEQKQQADGRVAEISLEVLVLTQWSGKDHFHMMGPRGGGMAVSE